jgi:hypothetical protein
MNNNKILAKWAGVKIRFTNSTSDTSGFVAKWQPQSDENQLSMLEAKMIEDTMSSHYEVGTIDTPDGYYCIYYEGDGIRSSILTDGQGKTISEAKYNAILKFAKKSMK